MLVGALACGGSGPRQEPAAARGVLKARYQPVPMVELQTRVEDLSWDEPDESQKN